TTGDGDTTTCVVEGLTTGVSYTFTVTATSDAGTSPASAASDAVLVKAANPIDFTDPADTTFGGGEVSLSATAPGGVVVFESTTTGVCTVADATVALVGAGTCSITATQAGDADYVEATPVIQTFEVAKAAASISFGSAPSVLVGATGDVSATATSGETVVFTSDSTDYCTVSGATVTGVTAGTCVISGSAPEGANYVAAGPTTQSFAVGKGTQTITFGEAPSVVVGGTGDVSASTDSSSPVTFSSATSGVCTVSGSTVTGVTAGDCVIKANAVADTNYNAAAQAEQSFEVSTTNPGVPTAVFGTPGNGEVVLTWLAPNDTGGSAITGYKVEQSDGGDWTTVVADTGSTENAYTVTGLTNESSYTFRLSTITPVGASAPSAETSQVTPSENLFVSSWKTDNTGPSADNEVTLPLYSTGTYDFTAYWGDGSSSEIDTWDDVDKTHAYAEVGEYTITIQGQIIGWVTLTQDAQKLLDISNWGSLRVGNTGSYFYGTTNMTVTAEDSLDLTGTTNLTQAFTNAALFNADLSDWDVSGVTNMNKVFAGASNFNGDITGWSTGNVTNMSYMFSGATAFNQDISQWDTSRVSSMGRMFQDAAVFNTNISAWNTSSVTDMAQMFSGASAFNQPLTGWDTSSVRSMYRMFYDASSFDQSLATFNVESLESGDDEDDMSDAASRILQRTSLSTANYDALLVSWGAQAVGTFIEFGAGDTTYSVGLPSDRRAALEGMDWEILDGGESP
ncbi:MAG: BspA family leucine-rich repeat surface protein, partial [Polaribacter sp.]|uniref:BspA family leucine-rich repeat surface protein n=1 Tax=Polaribacter sp. TaxID=1920175 RepID=UPI003BB00776